MEKVRQSAAKYPSEFRGIGRVRLLLDTVYDLFTAREDQKAKIEEGER